SWVKATDRATSIGGAIAWVIIVGSLIGGACFMSLIGFFVLWAGLRERWVVRLKHRAEAFGGSRGRFAGFEQLLRQRGGGVPLGETLFDAPNDEPRPESTGRSQGFTDEDIERLESFRGRLQKPNPEADA
ncbi:MAG: hypothetical protein AAGA20_24430, partial [Planctomycetota bacterium]